MHMAEEQKPATQADIETMKKELADIKNEVMKKELEAIKHERMKKELADIKAERESKPIVPKAEYKPVGNPLLIPAVIIAILLFLVAGYMIGTLYGFDVSGTVDQLISGYSLPVEGATIVFAASLALAVIGAGLIFLAKNN
jgi:hypothetical protein